MFNVSGGEIIVILLLALVVLGPEKLPDAMRRAGRTYSELKRMSSSFQTEMRSALDEPMQEMRETADLLRNAATFDPKAAATSSTSSQSSSPSKSSPPPSPTPSPNTPAVADAVAEPAPETDAELINRTLSGGASADGEAAAADEATDDTTDDTADEADGAATA